MINELEFDILSPKTFITVRGRKNAERMFWEAAIVDDSVSLYYAETSNPVPVTILETEKAWKRHSSAPVPFKVWEVEQHLAKLRAERGIVQRTT